MLFQISKALHNKLLAHVVRLSSCKILFNKNNNYGCLLLKRIISFGLTACFTCRIMELLTFLKNHSWHDSLLSLQMEPMTGIKVLVRDINVPYLIPHGVLHATDHSFILFDIYNVCECEYE